MFLKIRYPKCPCCGHQIYVPKPGKWETFKEFCKEIYFFDGNNIEEPKWLPFVTGLFGGVILIGIVSLFYGGKAACPLCRNIIKLNVSQCESCGAKLRWR